MKKLLGILPGVIPRVRIFKNFYYGLRYQLHLGSTSVISLRQQTILLPLHFWFRQWGTP